MEEMINIAKILKNKPKGTRLYSPIFGECAFSLVREETDDICVKKHNGEKAFFDSKGLYNALGECLLFPSREMRDWSKFAWKKGDVLISDCGFVCIFKEWASDDYTKFNGCYFDGMPNAKTDKYSKLDNNTAYGYIREIERKLGGKLNLETLEIEKQLEFKDGDIVSLEIRYIDSEDVIAETYILHGDYHNGENLNFYAGYRDNITDKVIYNSFVRPDKTSVRKELLRYATEEEKQQLFDALEKEGKAWDSEKKAIVDLKPKWIPKPFDRVITRNAADDVWTANIFSHMDSHGEYVTIACVGGYTHCLPYNDETAKLIGTTNNWEGQVWTKLLKKNL